MEEKAGEKSLEQEVNTVVKEHGGMISKKMANGILESRKKEGSASKARLNDLLSGKFPDGSIVRIEEHIYRIFNKKSFNVSGRERTRRNMVLGNDSANILLTLWDKHAEMADNILMERGDRILADGLRLKKSEYGYELSNLTNTYLARLASSKTSILDFSMLKPGERSIDVTGKIISIGNIRHFNDLKGREGSVSDATISDGKKELRLVMWGSSSIYAGSMHPGDLVKIEFATVKETANGMEISASDSSRLLIKSRIQQPKS